MRRGGDLSFAEAMKTEFRIVSRIFEGQDFFEGVRAVLIDKDGKPAMAAGGPSDAVDKATIDALLRRSRSRRTGDRVMTRTGNHRATQEAALRAPSDRIEESAGASAPRWTLVMTWFMRRSPSSGS